MADSTLANGLFGTDLKEGEKISFYFKRIPSPYIEGDTLLLVEKHIIKDGKRNIVEKLEYNNT